MKSDLVVDASLEVSCFCLNMSNGSQDTNSTNEVERLNPTARPVLLIQHQRGGSARSDEQCLIPTTRQVLLKQHQ
jgi:hypothetical protein